MENVVNQLTPHDILSLEDFQHIRVKRKKDIQDLKVQRRIFVGPFAVFHFECWQTMWWQIQEMLRIEKGGEAQLRDELQAYNPLLPQPGVLSATLMLEIPSPQERRAILQTLGGIENTIALVIGSTFIKGQPLDSPEDRTTSDGKTSAVHFLHFHIKHDNQALLCSNEPPTVRLVFTHPHYTYDTALSKEQVQSLAQTLPG